MQRKIRSDRANATAAILRACDVVFGSATCCLAAVASFAAWRGGNSVASAALLWGMVAVNIALSQWSVRVEGGAVEALRSVVNLPVCVGIYIVSQGALSRLVFPALAMVVAQGLFWGLRTGRAHVGGAITLVYGFCLIGAGAWFLPGTLIVDFTKAVSVVILGLVVSLVGGYLGATLADIQRERERAEQGKAELEVAIQARRIATERLDAVLDCASTLIVTLDRDGRVDFVNHLPPYVERKRVLGRFWLDLLPRAEHDALAARLQRVLAGGPAEQYDIRITRPDGKALWYSSHMAAMTSGGSAFGVVITSEDVTELRHTQVDYLASLKMAAIGTLASGVAHEINTPIQFVTDSISFLREASESTHEVTAALEEVVRLAGSRASAADIDQAITEVARVKDEADWDFLLEKVPQAFATSTDGLQRVAKIVRSMKEFAHASRPDGAPADINHAIENTLIIARNEYKDVADIERDFDALPPVSCHIDDINQVILNLVVNAAHAIGDKFAQTGERGRITVRTRKDGDDVIIAVTDTGCGIDEKIRHRIFEPFFTTKAVGRGSGQGLALAWKIVTDQHGGQLSLDSEVGRGTTFYMRLPITAKDVQPAAAA